MRLCARAAEEDRAKEMAQEAVAKVSSAVSLIPVSAFASQRLESAASAIVRWY